MPGLNIIHEEVASALNETDHAEPLMKADILMNQTVEPVYEQIDTSSRRQAVIPLNQLAVQTQFTNVKPSQVLKTDSVLLYDPSMTYHY